MSLEQGRELAADEIESLIEDACRRWRLPGIACVIVTDGEPRVIVRGFADLAEGREVDARTIFRVASISKTFTAVAVMQLWESGRFGLDDRVNDHLRAYRLSRDDVTIRHLLTHTAGIGELVRGRDIFRPAALGMIRPGRPLPSLRDIYGPTQRVAVAPGTKWAYANHGFATLGQLVEDVSGEPFAAYMKSQVLEPLGMTQASFLRDAEVDKALATGYRFRRGLPVPVKYRELTTTGAGALFCSATDMIAYIAALGRDGSPLLQSATLEMMLTPQYPPGEDLPAMGLAFSLRRIGSYLVAGHGGDLPGFKSALRLVPSGPGVFVSTNCNGSIDIEFALAIEGLADRIVGRLLSAGEETPDPAREDRHVSNEMLGLYRPRRGFLTNARLWVMFGGEIEVVASRSGFALRSPWGLLRKPLALEVHGENFRVKRGDFDGHVRFEQRSNGRSTALHFKSNVGLFTLYRCPRLRSLRHYVLTGGASLVALLTKGMARRRLVR
jgi:CubicO group peptidase (beta-lactamase class C family)